MRDKIVFRSSRRLDDKNTGARVLANRRLKKEKRKDASITRIFLGIEEDKLYYTIIPAFPGAQHIQQIN